MKILILSSILIITTSLLNGQTNDCVCFNGIGSTENDKPSLILEFSNGYKISICGYEEKKISDNKVLISEFNVFNCKTGESYAEYGALQNCQVFIENGILLIIELKYLPAGDNWEWTQIEIGLQQIFVKENEFIVLDQKPAYDRVEISKTKIDSFFKELRELNGSGKLDNPEEILGRLEILALNDIHEAITILNDFENYFDFQTDGAIAEQWKDAIATVNWINE